MLTRRSFFCIQVHFLCSFNGEIRLTKTKEISECKHLHKKWPSNHLAFAALNKMFGYLSAQQTKKNQDKFL